MGRSYLFECSKCGYKTKVSGGADQGWDCHVQTVHCRECRTLYDAVVRLRIPHKPAVKGILDPWRMPASRLSADVPPAFTWVVGQLPFSGTRFNWVEFGIRCPVSATHQVRAWNEPGKCPKCGVYLEKSALPYRIWE